MPAASPPVNLLVMFLMLTLLAAVIASWIWIALRIAFRAPILPRFEPRIVPWGGKSVLAALVLWLAVQIVGQAVFVLATHGRVNRPKGAPPILSPSEMMVASALQNTAILVLVPLLLAALSGARLRDFGLLELRRRAGWQVLQGVGAWPIAAPVIYGMMIVAVAIWGKQNHPLESAIQNDGVGRMAFVFFLAGAILAPAAEELIFRGVLLGWLTRLAIRPHVGDAADLVPGQSTPEADAPIDGEGALPTTELPALNLATDDDNPDTPPLAPVDHDPLEADSGAGPTPIPLTSERVIPLTVANVGVSILFAGLHYSVWPTPVPIFFLSLVLGILYQRTGSLVAPVALHMTFNGVSTVMMLLTVGLGIQMDPNAPPKTPLPVPAPIPKPLPSPVTPVAVIGLKQETGIFPE